MKNAGLVFAAVLFGGGISPAAAQTLTKCVAGQAVIDREGKIGVIIADDSKLCQVKYSDGQIYNWIFWNLQPAPAPSKSAAILSGTAPPAAPSPAPSSNSAQSPTVLRPSSSRTLVYRADRRGRFTIIAAVNGASVPFLVDTGADTVALTLADARAAGINPDALVFNERTFTANGVGRAARVMLHEISIDQLSIDNVPAVVSANLGGSLLGLSFLRRLKSFEVREGALTISW
jgi:aspartyl protease family protein